VEVGSSTDVQAIYQAAINGNGIPLLVSIFFSIIAGFIVLGITVYAIPTGIMASAFTE
jgi:magnesium transporter